MMFDDCRQRAGSSSEGPEVGLMATRCDVLPVGAPRDRNGAVWEGLYSDEIAAGNVIHKQCRFIVYRGDPVRVR